MRRVVLHRILGTATAVALVAGFMAACAAPNRDRGTDSSTSSDLAGVPSSFRPPEPSSVPAPTWSMLLPSGPSLGAFRDQSNNFEGADEPTIAPVPVAGGPAAIRFDMPGGGKRSEIEPSLPYFREGDEAWYGFTWYLPDDFPVDTSDWQVIAQWKNEGDGSPPVEIKVRDGMFVLDGGAGGSDPTTDYFSQNIGPARAGNFTSLVVRIKFSSDSSEGAVDVWQNGQQRINGFQPPAGTLYPGRDSYLKTGIYRDTAIESDSTLFLVDARIAPSLESASALRFP